MPARDRPLEHRTKVEPKNTCQHMWSSPRTPVIICKVEPQDAGIEGGTLARIPNQHMALTQFSCAVLQESIQAVSVLD